jgi:DNA-binding response OmpR family regulator
MSTRSATILVVEDDRTTRAFLADNLTRDGFELLDAQGAVEAQRLIASESPDLALVDLGLPDRDGLELLAWIRRRDRSAGRGHALPVIVFSGRGSEIDRLRGFDRGADDYVVKGAVSYGELRARIEALLRRSGARGNGDRVTMGPLQVDLKARTVWLRGEPVRLSGKEYALLRVLVGDPARVFTRQELLAEIWGFTERVPTRTLDAHAFRLRRKLGVHGDQFVVNVWGIGFRLLDEGAL